MTVASGPETRRPIVVRGAGDLATGVILALHRSGYPVVALETAAPSAIRRTVSLSEAVYEGRASVEGIEARLAGKEGEVRSALEEGLVPLLVDPAASSLAWLRPLALVDAIMAKRNLGTGRGMAPLVIALGPGFVAGEDVDLVVETQRGHDLARLIRRGRAAADTGIPGEVGGASADRVIHALAFGRLVALEAIGSSVTRNELIAYIESNTTRFNVYSKIDGILRGLIRSGAEVRAGLKIADVDPRGQAENCWTVSDKARALGGSVLEALLGAGILPPLRPGAGWQGSEARRWETAQGEKG